MHRGREALELHKPVGLNAGVVVIVGRVTESQSEHIARFQHVALTGRSLCGRRRSNRVRLLCECDNPESQHGQLYDRDENRSLHAQLQHYGSLRLEQLRSYSRGLKLPGLNSRVFVPPGYKANGLKNMP